MSVFYKINAKYNTEQSSQLQHRETKKISKKIHLFHSEIKKEIMNSA